MTSTAFLTCASVWLVVMNSRSACRALGNRGMDDRLDDDAAAEEGPGKQQAFDRVADDDRNDRGSAGKTGVEAAFAREGEEEARQLMEPGDALGLAPQERQGRERGGRVGRRDADAVDEPGGSVLEVFDERGGTRDVAAAAGERLGERAHPQLDAGAIDVGVLADTASGTAHGSQRMGLVDEQHRAMLLLDFDKTREVGKVAVHAVDAFDRDQHAAEAVADAGEQRVERAPVVVREATARRAGEPSALQDRVVGEDVVDDEVARAHQVADRRDVGRVPGDEDDRRGCA